MKVEIFHTAGCKKCAAAQAELRHAAESVVPGVEWRDVNVLDELDRAVALGVFSLPAVVIDEQLAFSASLPSAGQLGDAVRARANRDR